jgi:RNA polymerase sigma factor (sigma-70 family)
VAFGIARHLLGRYLRKQWADRSARGALDMPDRTLSAADADAIERWIDFEAVGRNVRDALGELGADQRHAVVLRIVDGLDYSQIARRLGCSEPTARARVSRGLRALGLLLAISDQTGTQT